MVPFLLSLLKMALSEYVRNLPHKLTSHNLSLNQSNPLNIFFNCQIPMVQCRHKTYNSQYFQVQNTWVAVIQHIRSIWLDKKKFAYDVEIEKLGNLESSKYTIASCCPHKANIQQSSKRPPTLSRFNRKILSGGLHQKHWRILWSPKGVFQVASLIKIRNPNKKVPLHSPDIPHPFPAS